MSRTPVFDNIKRNIAAENLNSTCQDLVPLRHSALACGRNLPSQCPKKIQIDTGQGQTKRRKHGCQADVGQPPNSVPNPDFEASDAP